MFGERRSKVGRVVFGHVVSAVNGQASQISRPRPPHIEHVTVEVLHVVLCRPRDERRAEQLPALGAVEIVDGPVDAEAAR